LAVSVWTVVLAFCEIDIGGERVGLTRRNRLILRRDRRDLGHDIRRVGDGSLRLRLACRRRQIVCGARLNAEPGQFEIDDTVDLGSRHVGHDIEVGHAGLRQRQRAVECAGIARGRRGAQRRELAGQIGQEFFVGEPLGRSLCQRRVLGLRRRELALQKLNLGGVGGLRLKLGDLIVEARREGIVDRVQRQLILVLRTRREGGREESAQRDGHHATCCPDAVAAGSAARRSCHGAFVAPQPILSLTSSFIGVKAR
jgi:hypothetical protein